MGKKTTIYIKSKKSLIMLVVLGLIGSAIIALIVFNQIDIARDRQRFESVRKKNSAIAAQFAVDLGKNVKSQTQLNLCFNSEQGPYNDGRLWCQVSTITTLNQDLSFEELTNQMQQAARLEKVSINTSGMGKFATLWYGLPEGFTCSMLVMDQQGREVGSVTYDPLTDGRGPSVAVACADRAKAAYYPFVP